MKQHNEPKKVPLFSKNVTYSQNLNFMYSCHGYQNKILSEFQVIIYCDDSVIF